MVSRTSFAVILMDILMVILMDILMVILMDSIWQMHKRRFK